MQKYWLLIGLMQILCISYGYCQAAKTHNTNSVIIFILYEKSFKFSLKKWTSQFKTQLQENTNLTALEISPIELDRSKTKEIEHQLCKKMKKKGISLVIDTTVGGYSYLDELQKKNNLPYIQVSITKFPWVYSVIQYIKEKFGNDYAIIFQSVEEEEMGIFSMIAYTNTRVIVLGPLDRDAIKRMKTLNPQPSFFAIAADTENMNEIFEMVIENRLAKRDKYDRWILLFLDFKSKKFNDDMNKYPEIAKLIPENKICCDWMNLESNCTCPKRFSIEEQLFKTVMKNVLLVLKNYSYPITYQPCESQSEEKAYAPWHMDIVRELKKDERIKMKENYLFQYIVNISIHVARNDNLAKNVLAGYYYDESIHLIDKSKPLKSARRYFRIGTTLAIPWVYYKKDPNTNEFIYDKNNITILEGYCIEMIEKLAIEMKFDYEILQPESGTYGKKIDDKWDGLIGDLVSDRIDLAVASLKMTADRESVADFIAPYFAQTGILIVMRKPLYTKSLFKFMTVLRLEVWLSILGALLAVAIMIWILERLSPYSARNSLEFNTNPSRKFTLKESFWFALTSFTPQGGGEVPKAISGRTLVGAYWLFVLLMLATFTANLAAYLTLERMQTPVASLEELAKQSRINYTVVENSDTHDYFKNMKTAEDTIFIKWKEITLNTSNSNSAFRVWDYPINERFGNMLTSIQQSGLLKTAKEGFHKVNEILTADFAFIHDSAEIKYEISRNCNFTEVGEVFAEQPYALAVQQGSHLQDELSRVLLTLQKERFFDKMKNKYWNISLKGECDDYDETEGISLQSLGGVFIATLFGLILAIVTLFVEIYYFRKQEEESGIIEHKPKNDDTVLDKSNLPDVETQNKTSHLSIFPRNTIYRQNYTSVD